MTYTELYPKLVLLESLVPMDILLMQPPYPRWYNENARCDYHSDNRRHSTEDILELYIEKDVKVVCMPMKTVYKPCLGQVRWMKNKRRKEKIKTGKDSIVNTIRGPWATPFKTVKIF